MNRYVVIKKIDLEPTMVHSSNWPKLVAFCKDNSLFLVLEGKGHGINGGEFNISQLKSNVWVEFIDELGVFWLKNIILSNNDDYEKIKKIEQVVGTIKPVEIINY